MFAMNKISSQLIVVVFVALGVFGLGVAGTIGFQSYSDLEEVALEQVETSAHLFKSDYETVIGRVYDAISAVGTDQSISEQIVLLSTYGPLYSEDSEMVGRDIEEALTSFYLQAQLKIVRSLIHLLPQNNLSHLALYHLDPFNSFENSHPLPAFIINGDTVWLYRYHSKAVNSNFTVYKLPLVNLNVGEDLFDISSVYQERADFFYDTIGVEKVSDLPFEHFKALGRPKIYSGGHVIHTLNGEFGAAVWAPISSNLTSPKTWERTPAYASVIVGMHELTQSGLNAISLRLDADIAIESDENVWISTINGHERFKMTETQHTVIDEAQYLFSEVSIDLPSNKPEEIFNVIALKPTEGLMDRTKSLISRLFILSFVAIMLTAFAIYILVRSKLRDPLENLMDGVKKMQEGRADVQVDIHVKNELATLGRSFNEMAKDVQQKSKELQLANDTLEGKVKKRTQDLQSAQKKLILSEKMASLGQLVAGVAHEINTPLGNCVTALSFNADTLEELKRKYADQKLTATDFRQFLSSSSESMQLMEKNLMRAAELMRTFKNVAVSQSVEEVSSFRLKQHIEEVLLTLNPQMRHSKIDVSIDVDEGIEVKSFAGAYYQLMSNLILNSVRHAFPDKKGHISIKIEKQAEALYFSYSDDGAGMDPQTLNKIFDPFFTTKRGAGGTGLGMYMIYNIVTQLLGGSIKASSVQGEGTQFEILLPIELPQKNAGAEHYSI